MNELQIILVKEYCQAIPTKYRSLNQEQIEKLPYSELKGILLEYYSSIRNRIAYKELKERSLQYANKLKKGISKEGYTIREKLLVWNEDAWEELIAYVNTEYE